MIAFYVLVSDRFQPPGGGGMLKLRFDRYIRQLCNMFNFQIYIYYIENRQLFFRKQVDNHTADNIESLPGAVTRIARKRDKKHACAHDLGFRSSHAHTNVLGSVLLYFFHFVTFI